MTYYDDEIKERVVRNNGKNIGKSKSYKGNMIKIAKSKGIKIVSTIATVSLISGLGAGYVIGKSVNSPINVVISNNTVNDIYDGEPRYNGIPYKVQTGDTLLGIVYSYETDANEVAKIVQEICRLNDINNASSISDREEILLCGVPSSKLDEYGYTDNYNYFDPSLEVNDRLEFISKLLNDVEDEEISQSYQKINEEYKEYNYEHIDGDEDKLDIILDELRDLCEEVNEKYMRDFEYNKKAMPLSQANINVKEVSYAN